MFKKLENLIVLLVAISAIAIMLHKFIPRELTVRPGGDWITRAADDRIESGNSFATDLSDDNQFAFGYDIREGKTNPFACLLILPPEDELLDLSWMESVTITAHTEGQKSGAYRLQLRNRDEEYYSPDDNISLRYDEVCLNLTDQPTAQTISINNFYVPAWWIERMSVPLVDSRPKVDRIAGIELNTSHLTDNGRCRAVISEIKFSGHWISTSLFYQIISGMWLCFGSLVALTQIIALRKRLMQSETKELSLQYQATKLEELATLDPLTQLYNRRGMRPHASHAMQDLEQSGNNFSLIMFDIDNFKTLNDEHGHGYGDQILQRVSAAVSECLSENEPLARWGGEEFLTICKDTKLDGASQLAQQLRESVEEKVKVTCSFGVCEVGPGLEFSEALDLVDRCLYQAKNAGKNCVKTARTDSCEKPELAESSAAN